MYVFIKIHGTTDLRSVGLIAHNWGGGVLAEKVLNSLVVWL
jgi:hypothetical protein